MMGGQDARAPAHFDTVSYSFPFNVGQVSKSAVFYRQVGNLACAKGRLGKLSYFFSPRPKRVDIENACFPDVFRASATFSKTSIGCFQGFS
jgi:hypothetical protein